MFFQKDYARPGPGIRPDEPEKTGWKRFWEILTLEYGSLLKLNLLVLLTCLPVVTIPAALYAMNMVVRRMVCDETVDCTYHYKQALRQNWKTAYAAFFVAAIPLAAAGCGLHVYLRLAESNPLFLLPFAFCGAVFLLTVLASVYLYPLLSTGLTVRDALRPAIIMGGGKPLRAVLAALGVYGLTGAAVLAFPVSILYLLLVGFTAPCLLGNFFVRTVVRQYF